MKFYKFGIALALTTLMSSVLAQGVPHERVIQDFTRTNRLTGTPLAPAGVIPNQSQSFGGMYYWVYGCVGANPFTGSCSCPSGYTAQLFSAVNGEGGRDIYVCNKV